MRELFYKIKELAECPMLNFHRDMLRIEHDAVLVVIYIRGILEAPFAVLDGYRDDPVVLPGGMVDAARITFILHAEQALGVAALLGVFSGSDSLGILLRLGKVDGDIHFTVRGLGLPFYVLGNAVTADVIAVLA